MNTLYNLIDKGQKLIELYKDGNIAIDHLIKRLEYIATFTENIDKKSAENLQFEINNLEIIYAVKYHNYRNDFLESEKDKIAEIISVISQILTNITTSYQDNIYYANDNTIDEMKKMPTTKYHEGLASHFFIP